MQNFEHQKKILINLHKIEILLAKLLFLQMKYTIFPFQKPVIVLVIS
jgi:hypothetical protein